MPKSIEEAITELEKEVAEKQAALKVLYQLVGKSPGLTDSEINGSSNLNKGIGFPHAARTDKQVMFLFDKIFTKAEKFATVQKKYNELSGIERNIYNVCRSMKKSNLLATVQYNKQNKLSFWGKAGWLGKNDFKEEFKPDQNEMPIEVYDIRILTDDDEILL